LDRERAKPMRTIFWYVVAAALVMPSITSAEGLEATERARAGSFDVRGEVACAQEVGQTMGTCTAAVARVGNSAAAVVVTFPNGFARTLIFEDRIFVRGNPTMSGVGTDTDWRVSDGTHLVRVDDQRFELPEGLVFTE